MCFHTVAWTHAHKHLDSLSYGTLLHRFSMDEDLVGYFTVNVVVYPLIEDRISDIGDACFRPKIYITC